MFDLSRTRGVSDRIGAGQGNHRRSADEKRRFGGCEKRPSTINSKLGKGSEKQRWTS